jgi:hypothetical protein
MTVNAAAGQAASLLPVPFNREDWTMSSGKAKRHIAGILSALALLALAVTVPEARADTTRSCTATIHISPAGGGNGVSHTFTGRGTTNTFRPNTARERALNNIDECLNAHWANPHGLRPAACTQANQVFNYPYRRLHQEVALEACNANPARERIFLNVTVTYQGDTGCIRHPNIWARTIRENYLVQCATQQNYERGVDRPGMDYRHFQTRGGWQACQTACAGESQCRAWTYVNPTTPNGPGTCWLKNGVPSPRACANCTSGVMVQLH